MFDKNLDSVVIQDLLDETRNAVRKFSNSLAQWDQRTIRQWLEVEGTLNWDGKVVEKEDKIYNPLGENVPILHNTDA